MARERIVNAPAMSTAVPEDNEPVVHWRQTDDEDEATVFYGESNRPRAVISTFPYQRHRPPSSKFLEPEFDEDN